MEVLDKAHNRLSYFGLDAGRLYLIILIIVIFSFFVTGNVITKLNPKEGLIRSVSDFVTLGKVSDNGRRKRWSKCRTDEERQEDMLPELVPVEGTQIR